MLPCLKNVHVAANEYKGELIFLHKVKDGAVDDSYGIQVAKLADLPEEVINRAQIILDEFEQKPSDQIMPNELSQDNHEDSLSTNESNNSINTEKTINSKNDFEQASFDLFEKNDQQSEIELEIKNLNLSNMTPIEALVKLSDLQKQLR